MHLQFNINLTKAQKEIYDIAHSKDYKYITTVLSRQSGKSVLMKILCIEWLLTKKYKHIAYVCRNYILAKSIYRDMVQYIPQSMLTQVNASDLLIKAKNGCTIQFLSAESGNSLRGQTFSFLILDEFAFFNFELPDGSHLWNDVLFPTVKVRGEKVIFVSTPLGKNNMLYEMYMRGLSPEYPKYYSILRTIYDDGLVSPDEIEEIRKSVPEMSFRQEFMCEFLDSSTSYFQNTSDCFYSDFQYDTSSAQYIGIDVSTIGQDNTILTVINQKQQVIQYKIDGSLDEKYRKIADIINGTRNLKRTYIESNSIGVGFANEIRKLINNDNNFKTFDTTSKTKQEIIGSLSVAIANKEIYFNSNDIELKRELDGFEATYTKTGQLKFGGHNVHDDRVMSLAIALRCKQDCTKKGGYKFGLNGM